MKLNKKTISLISELEYIIGSECYNPNSYDGWNDIEGCSFRYPINVADEEGNYTKTWFHINTRSCVTPDTVGYIKYKFGSNELFIGKGIIKALEYIEERYGIDFCQLENQISSKNSKK